jgi:predicted ATP-dependent endonuclease of OLD family
MANPAPWLSDDSLSAKRRLLLCSHDAAPLIIDQPEDHLDSAFIFETIVTTLRNIKERRQVILATHNPNIAVLGDAELIVPMQGFGNVGRIRDSGAVDADSTRKRRPQP